MENKLVKMMARVIYRQDRTRGVKRYIINNHYWRLIKICDRLSFNWRSIIRQAEIMNGYTH